MESLAAGLLTAEPVLWTPHGPLLLQRRMVGAGVEFGGTDPKILTRGTTLGKLFHFLKPLFPNLLNEINNIYLEML